MKKIAIVGMMLLALGATSFARGHHNNWHNEACPRVQGYDARPNGVGVTRRNPESERTRLVIDEKKLEIRKELTRETPDWKKVERLNTEIATEQGKTRTANMKSRFEARQNVEQQLQKNN